MENIFKKINTVFLIALAITISISIFSYFAKTTQTIDASGDSKINKIKILIDPGHGGVDPGASGDITDAGEAPINLAIALKLMKLLEGSGFEVHMTRYDSNGLYTDASTYRSKKNQDLENRTEIINKSDADMVVSIHLNSFPQKQYYGAHVFYKKGSDKSKLAADTVQNFMKEMLDKNNNRVPQIKKDIKIMDDSIKPVILIECGFLSNPVEERKLIMDEYQENIAWSIFIGLIEYFNKL
jgi:N-acetylmuramoyl-L-alanine amidase